MVGIVMVCLYYNVWGCMCGFCTLWMCEAYVILWVGIWWILLWCCCIELVIILLRDFVYFVIGVCMCGFCTVWM